jgi:hypothetical protein
MLHDAHRHDIHGRLYRFVQVPGYECSYLSHESMIVNIPCFHRKDDRYSPGISPCHFHDGPYGDLICIQEIDKKRIATGYVVAISRYRPLRRTQQMLRVRVLENAFLRDMSFSAQRRESDDISRKPTLHVFPPIQSIAVGCSGQWSREKKSFLRHIQ